MMHITLIYAGLLGLLFLLLSFWVVKRRAQFRVMIGEEKPPRCWPRSAPTATLPSTCPSPCC